MSEQPLNHTTVEFPQGAYITIEGEKNDGCFFIVRKGKIRLSRETQMPNDDPSGSVLGPGDLLGVISTMAYRSSHIETARAMTDVTLVPVRRDQFGQIIRTNNQVAIKIITQFSKRMRGLNEALTKPVSSKKAVTQNTPEKHYTTDGRTRVYPQNAVIFSEGESGDEVFVIKSGSVKITKKAENGEILLAILPSGNIFGEMALLDSAPRTATATAREECQLMVLNQANFDQVISTQPQIITLLTTLLAERIWLAYKQLANALIPDPVGRMYDMLLINLEKKQVDLESKLRYTFDFGIKELACMVGLLPDDSGILTAEKILQNKYIEMVQDKISIRNVQGFVGQAAYYRKLQIKQLKTRDLNLTSKS